MNIIKVKNHLTVVLSDGQLFINSNCTGVFYNTIMENQSDESVVKKLMVPNLVEKEIEVEVKKQILNDFSSSKYLTVFANSVYIKSISELTVPEDLAVALCKAEMEKDQEKIDSYLNFWTLASLNPDSRARTNLFWFLNRYGMTISKSGLFVAYRNVELKSEGKGIQSDLATFVSNEYIRVKTKLKKSPKNYFVGYKDDVLVCGPDYSKFDKTSGTLQDLYQKLSDVEIAPVYTDSYSKKFTIQIGTPVTMDRSKCNSNQDQTCSHGLHVAGRSWLSDGYFGKISLMVLVNPADVVVVPPSDNYGKMRVCAYYPIQVIKRDANGNIIDEKINDGFEDDFIDKIVVSGNINNVDDANYVITVPDIPEINRTTIMKRLQSISSNMKKYVN